VVIDGDTLTCDFTGSSHQAAGPMNATYAVTASAVYNAFLHITDPTIPRNEGCYRPINTIAPPGTIVNCEFPAPLVGGNTEVSPRITDIIFGALADALPERIPASLGGTSCCFLFGGEHPDTGELYSHFHFEGIGWGGRPTKDGNSQVIVINGNCRNTPVEVFETRFPVLVRRYELVPDSGGAGRRRGGLATRRVLEVTAPEVTVSALMDRVREGAWGLFGGQPGRPAAIRVRRRGDAGFATFQEAFDTVSPSKFSNVVLREGDEVLLESAGGGGYGEPRQRERELVAEDVAEGYVTPEAAARDYGLED
jgi:N-methylhydantoinase B/oxoprolinase/acetone carboxylase alpha subunit